jgi:phosphoribosylformylglycinamidine cyclo-ligase
LSRKFAYANAGVDREKRARSKETLRLLRQTYKLSHYGDVVELPYGNIFPVGKDLFLDLAIEGVGTKVLVAELARKYDTIGIDGVAMVVNDVIRSGAKPLALSDNIHAHVSEPSLIEQWLRGIAHGAFEADCVVPSGEIGDVPDLIKGIVEGEGFDMVVAAVGEVTRDKMILGKDLVPGDAVIGLRSSGVHSNGISLARKILFKRWGGKYEARDIPEESDREIVLEVLEPTRIYVKPVLATAEKLRAKAAVHITGDAYLKFGRLAKFSKHIGFQFDNFDPQPIFGLIQKTAAELGGVLADEEMFKTFNMGWGFALVVDKDDADRAVTILKKTRVQAEQIGQVTDHEGIRIKYKKKKITLN